MTDLIARDLLILSGSVTEVIHRVEIPGNPWPKGRPRKGKGGRVYTTKKDLEHETVTALYLRQGVRQKLRGNLACSFIFYRADRRQADADNLIKHVLDAANGVLFADDSQVTAGAWAIELDRLNPRTVLLIGRHHSSMIRDPEA